MRPPRLTLGDAVEPDKSLRVRAERVTPGGVQSNVRSLGPKPFVTRAAGARLWDQQGNDYVDHLLGQGPNLLGHAPPEVLLPTFEACKNGLVFAGQHQLEVDAAESVITTTGWPDMVRFTSSGTEAIQAAIRLSRACTGRTTIVRFQGHYHGWLDNVLITAQHDAWGPASAGQVYRRDEIVALPWNNFEAFDEFFAENGNDVAGVVTEPVMMNSGAIEPRPGYLEHLRQTCDRHGALLVFDEVVTGFRLALGGATEIYGVQPDLATYGKAIGAGFPVAALAGRAEYMQRFAVDTNHAGTFNGNVMASAAVVATLGALRADPPYDAMREHGESLIAGLLDIGSEAGLPLRVQGFPQAFHLSFGDGEVVDWETLQALDLKRYAEFSSVLVREGVWVSPRGIWFTSAAHGPAELDDVFERFTRASETIAR